METWKTIPEFDRYSVSDQGQVRNDDTGRILKLTMNQYGVLTVGLMYRGTQFRRSVPLLVAEAFVPGGTNVFDTPVCLDGDRFNCRANNINWRPRWFAVKYNRQFVEPYFAPIDRQIRNMKTGEIFVNSLECAKWYGVLEGDLVESIQFRTYVWPVYQEFEVM